MGLEIVDEVSTPGSNDARNGRTANAARPIVMHEESVQLGSSVAKPDSDDGDDDVVSFSGRNGGRALSASSRKILANIDKHGTAADEPDDDPDAAALNLGSDGKPKAAPAAEVKPADPAKPDEAAKPDPGAEHKAANDRLLARNRELLAELETHRAKPKGGELSPRMKSLLEISGELGIKSPAQAARRFFALVHGIDDHTSKEANALMRGLYEDLTEEELSVTPDPAQKALRESARTQQLWDREKRERKAAEDEAASKADDDVESKQTAETHALIGKEFSSIADRYPLTAAFAERIHGAKPEALIWRGIQHGVRSGALDGNLENKPLIEAVSQILETEYQALADQLVEARTKPSTAAPTPADGTKASPKGDTGQGHGSRTITTASASVAPATLPAPKSDPIVEQPVKYRNEAERRRALAAKHFAS